MLTIMRPGIKDTQVLVRKSNTLCKLHAIVVEHGVFRMHKHTSVCITFEFKRQEVHRIAQYVVIDRLFILPSAALNIPAAQRNFSNNFIHR